MRLLFLFIGVITTFYVQAQFPKFEIGGLARSFSQSSHLNKEDTINNDVSQDFNIVFDLAIKGSLNKYVSLYSELRMGSNLEVFDTSSSYLKLRRLLIFGDLNMSFSFEIGDIDLKMTPFTLWNSNQEGNINESILLVIIEIFKTMKISIMKIIGGGKEQVYLEISLFQTKIL